ncbi:MAG: TIGR04282 family arsenosugar biosynthesis glycosyltransferase [Thermodesulfobacteriota bacterium]
MNTIAIFLKHPTPGKVKTRIAKDIGNERAAQVYSAMAETVLEAVGTKNHRRVFYDPPDKKDEIANWLGADIARNFLPQRGNSLGEKISNAISDCLSDGSKKVSVIGTDCPDVTGEVIEESFARLDSADAVIGPCEDGGYYLIGLKHSRPELFTGIDWSTSKVTAQTLEKIQNLNLKAELLKTLRDIDSADALTPRLMNKLSSRGGVAAVEKE